MRVSGSLNRSQSSPVRLKKSTKENNFVVEDKYLKKVQNKASKRQVSSNSREKTTV